MDEVQLSDSAYQHRNIFLTLEGKTKYLTIPFVKSNYISKKFKEIEISDNRWQLDHWNFIQNNYKKHPFYKEIIPHLEIYYTTNFNSLFEAVLLSMNISFDLFGISSKVILQSSLNYDRTKHRGELVAELVKVNKGECYLSGMGGAEYMDKSFFEPSTRVIYNKFIHPIYSQHKMNEFTSGLSCLDALFNLGANTAAQVMRSNIK